MLLPDQVKIVGLMMSEDANAVAPSKGYDDGGSGLMGSWFLNGMLNNDMGGGG